MVGCQKGVKIVCGAFLLLAAGVASAMECVYKADSAVTDLTLETAWMDGAVPGENDIAVFNGQTPEVLTLGAATTWAGIIRTNAVNQLTLQAPEDGTLTLGAEGLRIYTQEKDREYWRFYFDVDITLSADQTWVWEMNKTPATKRGLAGPGKLTLKTNPDEWNNRSGNVMFGGPVTTSVTVGHAGIRIFLWENGSMGPAPTLVKNSNLILLPTARADGYHFAEFFPSRTFHTDGYFHFGGQFGNNAYSDRTNTIHLTAGDTLTRSRTEGDAAREQGHIYVQDTHVVSDGADVSNNVWFDLRNGSWTQKSGDTVFSYAGIVGRGSSASYGTKEQRLSIEGGTFAARRLTVGLGNGDTYPAEMWVSGGVYRSTLPDKEDNAGNWWASGLGLALRSINGETKKEDNRDVSFKDSDWAAGRLEISGGMVRTPVVLFGSDHNPWGHADIHAGARLALSGGRLEVGTGGVRLGKHWRNYDGQDGSWYDAVLSGGTLAFHKSETDATADLRLSDRNGGVSIEVPEGVSNVGISGSLYGTGSLFKTGKGALHLKGSNDYTGRTVVAEGRLAYGNRFETAVWTGDSLDALAEGDTIIPWTNAYSVSSADAEKWSFVHTTSIGGTSGTTPPTLARHAINGHHALSFNGANTCYLTGNAVQPIGNKGAFTVSVVIQTVPGFVGNASTNIAKATQFFGTSIPAENDGNEKQLLYGLALDDQGRVGCGVFGGRWLEKVEGEDGETTTLKDMDSEDLWSTNSINDGKPHVLVWSWSWQGEHVFCVDDQIYRLSSPSNGASSTRRTRIVLGVGERQDASKRFKGLMAELSMTPTAITATRGRELARELGIKYGVEAFKDENPWRDVAAADVEVPAATATWSADSLAETTGQAVEAWSEKDGKGASGGAWTFTRDLANKIFNNDGVTTAPVIAETSLAGHKLVSFNGRTSGMALTGSKATPVGNKDGLTVAMVVRFPQYGSGGETFGPGNSSAFFGSAFAANDHQENWQLMLSGAARVGVSHRSGENPSEAVRSRQRFLNNGEAHIVVARYPKKNSGDTVALFVDGYKEESLFVTTNVIVKTRILLGASEAYGGTRYAPVDVAEFRLWGGTVLTDEQVRALSEDLAATYDLELPAYTRGVATDGQQRSREVVVAAGAEFGGPGTFGAMLYPGQTLWGDGTVRGLLTLTPGAAVKATTANTLSVADGLELLNGAVLAADLASGAELKPVAVTGNVTLRGDAVVRLSVPEGMRPSGTLLSWTGRADLPGSAEPTFTVEGVKATSVRVKIDAENKCIKIVPQGGMQIFVR